MSADELCFARRRLLKRCAGPAAPAQAAPRIFGAGLAVEPTLAGRVELRQPDPPSKLRSRPLGRRRTQKCQAVEKPYLMRERKVC